MIVNLFTLIDFVFDVFYERGDIFLREEIKYHFIEDISGILKSLVDLLGEKKREIESVLLAIDKFCNFSFVDGDGLVLVGGVIVAGLAEVEEGVSS